MGTFWECSSSWTLYCFIVCSLFPETPFIAMVLWISCLYPLFYRRVAWNNLAITARCLLFPEEETVYRVLITDAPQVKEHTYLCQTLLKGRRDTAGTYPIERAAILYLQQDSAVTRLKKWR